ncbi:prolyl oligopeptidase family serine peptidase [Marisediminicola sp. LYQ134]|uniref:alpha/beta hydrolase family protein n=1 Tax=Marisediminicola sp. LYQ134 TaxID=3391061 RepID=UPI0039836429
MKPSDISALVTLGTPTIHPDGSRAVVATRRADVDANRYVGELWTVSLGRVDTPTGREATGREVTGGAPTRFTRGPLDSAPAFSPNGEWLAYQTEVDGRRQIALVPASTTGAGAAPDAPVTPVIATAAPLGVASFVWSPDSTRIAFIAGVLDPDRFARDASAPDDPRRITTLKYRSDGAGFDGDFDRDREAHVFLLDVTRPAQVGPVDSAIACQISTQAGTHTSIVFAPSGGSVFAVWTGLSSIRSTLTTSILEITFDAAYPRDHVYTPGNTPAKIAATTMGALAMGRHGELYFTATDQTGTEPQARLNVDATALMSVDTTNPRWTIPTGLIHLARDFRELDLAMVVTETGVIVPKRWDGRLDLVEVHGAGKGRTHVILSGDLEVTGFDERDGVVVASTSTAAHPATLVVVDPGGERALFSPADVSHLDILVPTEVTVTARDGHGLHGWVVEPPGVGPHPAIVLVPEGPYASFSISLFDEAQVYATAGYAVIMSDLRRAADFGESHARATRHDLGAPDRADILDFLAGVLERTPSIDSTRIGVAGASYGAWLAAWLTADENLFSAAIIERPYLDPSTYVGASDISVYFADDYPGSDRARLAALSIHDRIDGIDIPTLVIHAEHDRRNPSDQAERFYFALKRRGVDTELLLFAGESHDLPRTGSPRHRVQRLEATLEWWARHLPVSA